MLKSKQKIQEFVGKVKLFLKNKKNLTMTIVGTLLIVGIIASFGLFGNSNLELSGNIRGINKPIIKGYGYGIEVPKNVPRPQVNKQTLINIKR